MPESETRGRDIAVSPLASLAAVYGLEPGRFTIWNLETGASRVYRGHAKQVLTAAWSSDGRTLATAGEDRTIRVWQIEPPQLDDGTIKSHMVSMAVTSDAVYLSAEKYDHYSEPSRIHRIDLGNHERTIVGSADTSITGLDVLGDKTLITCAVGGTLQSWDLSSAPATNQTLHRSGWNGHIAASHNGPRIALAKYKPIKSPNPIELFELSNDEWQKTGSVVAPTWTVDVKFSPDGRLLVASEWSGNVRIWDVRTRSQIVELQGHSDVVWALAFSSDGKHLATVSSDRTARIWNLQTYACEAVLPHHDELFAVTFVPDQDRVVTGTAGGWLHFWAWKNERPLGFFRAGKHSIGALALTNDATRLIAAFADRRLEFFDCGRVNLKNNKSMSTVIE